MGDGGPGSWLRERVVVPWLEKRERAFSADLILIARETSLASARMLATALRRNRLVVITADVAMGDRLIALPVLGETKRFATGMVNLARQCGAPLLPLFCVREADGRVRVVIEPPIPVPETGDRDTRVTAPLRAYAARLEHWLARHPEQYRSWHYPWWQGRT
jgi:KDO2-lipid IV(A) lauroyltransferase